MRFQIPCAVCGGKGVITEQRMDWIKRGRVLGNKRCGDGLDITEFCSRHGLRIVEVVCAEWGIVDPTFLEEIWKKGNP